MSFDGLGAGEKVAFYALRPIKSMKFLWCKNSLEVKEIQTLKSTETYSSMKFDVFELELPQVGCTTDMAAVPDDLAAIKTELLKENDPQEEGRKVTEDKLFDQKGELFQRELRHRCQNYYQYVYFKIVFLQTRDKDLTSPQEDVKKFLVHSTTNRKPVAVVCPFYKMRNDPREVHRTFTMSFGLDKKRFDAELQNKPYSIEGASNPAIVKNFESFICDPTYERTVVQLSTIKKLYEDYINKLKIAESQKVETAVEKASGATKDADSLELKAQALRRRLIVV